MAGLVADVPAPIYLANTTGTGLQTLVLDASDAMQPGLPIPIQVVISATATVQILAGVEINTATGTIVDAQDVSGGGFTASNFYDLILNLPFYVVNITANTGTVKVKLNGGALAQGEKGRLHLLRMTNIATSGM